MESSAIFLKSLLVLLLAEHVTSRFSNCTCEIRVDIRRKGTTAVWGYVRDAELVTKEGHSIDDKNMAEKTRYQIEHLKLLNSGPHKLILDDNSFTIPVPIDSQCHNKLVDGESYIFIGKVNEDGRMCKLVCYLYHPPTSLEVS